MTVKLTAPVEGLQPGADYTGANEAYHLASGNASQVGYTGPGVANTGPTDVVPAKDPGLPANRGDKAHWPVEAESKANASIANSTTNLTKKAFANPDKPDFDQGGVDEDPGTPAADGDTDGDGTAN